MGEDTWVLVASLLIMAAIVCKILSQHVLTRLEKEVVRLEQMRKITIERLQKIRRRLKSAQGTKAFMERRKAEIEKQLGDIRGELQEPDDESEPTETGEDAAGEEVGEAAGEAEVAEEESASPEKDDKEIKVKHRSVRPFE